MLPIPYEGMTHYYYSYSYYYYYYYYYYVQIVRNEGDDKNKRIFRCAARVALPIIGRALLLDMMSEVELKSCFY
jgi:hypothetical protein